MELIYGLFNTFVRWTILIITKSIYEHDNYDYYWDVYVPGYPLWTTYLSFLKVGNFGSAITHPIDLSSPGPFFNIGPDVSVGLLYIKFVLSITIFYRRVPGIVTDCPCDVWCRGLTTCLLFVGPLFENLVLNNSWSVCVTKRKVIFHRF